MINNAGIWKRELRKELRIFSKFSTTINFSSETIDIDRTLLKIEKFFFVSCFIIRKLHESHKLSDELIGTNIPLEKHQRKKENINEFYDLINRFDIDDFFDLENPKKCSLGAIKLCNNIIHSLFFYPYIDNNPNAQPGKTLLAGIYFTSDKESKSTIYSISLLDFFSFIEQVIEDDIVSFTINRESGKTKKSKYMKQYEWQPNNLPIIQLD